MVLHVHSLSHLSHSDFLKQERKDPFTGQVLQSGDIVVFCANCKTAFLLASWEAVNNQHCNQHNTLREFPPQRETLIIKKKQPLYIQLYDSVILILQVLPEKKVQIASKITPILGAMVSFMENVQVCRIHFIVSTIFFPLVLVIIFLGIGYSLGILLVSLSISSAKQYFDSKDAEVQLISMFDNSMDLIVQKFISVSFLSFFSFKNIFSYIRQQDDNNDENNGDVFLYSTVWVLYFCLFSLFIIRIDIWLYMFILIFILIMQVLFLKIEP